MDPVSADSLIRGLGPWGTCVNHSRGDGKSAPFSSPLEGHLNPPEVEHIHL